MCPHRLLIYASFPLSDSDITNFRVVLLSMGLFPLSDSDVTIAKFRMGTNLALLECSIRQNQLFVVNAIIY